MVFAKIQKFFLALTSNVEAMRAALEHPTLNELSFAIEDHHAVGLLASGIRCDECRCDLAESTETPCVLPVLDFLAEVHPVVRDFITVLAFSYDRLLAPGLVACAENQWCAEAAAYSSEKGTATTDMNAFRYHTLSVSFDVVFS